MEQKLFLLIATFFCIGLVKSDDEYDYDTEPVLPEYTGEPGVGYPGDFPKAVLLTDVISSWGNDDPIPTCFREQYNNGSDYYKHAIDDATEELLQALAKTLDKAREKLVTEPKAEAGSEAGPEAEPEEDFETLAQTIQTSEQALGNLLKEYQQKLSDSVNENTFGGMKTLMEDYKKKIEDSEGKYNENYLKLKEIMFKDQDLKTTARDYENQRNTELDDLVDAGKQVMELLKKCIEEKKE